MPLMITGGSIIQSSFKVDGHPNFEAVVFIPRKGDQRGELQHYFRENHRPDKPWQKVRIVNDSKHAETNFEVIGPASFIEALVPFAHGHFELIVPEAGGLAHYWRDNDDLSQPWRRTGVFAPGATGPGAIVQDFENGHLEVVARVGSNLYHYWREENLTWHRTEPPITQKAAGAPDMIYSSYGNLEVVVQEGSQLVLYWRDHRADGLPWRWGGVVAPKITGSPGFVQGPHGSGDNRNFEVAVPVDDRVELYWRDNSDGNLPWKWGGVVTSGAGPVSAVALTSSGYDDYLEILSQECERSIFHLYRYVSGSERIWYRSACLCIDEGGFSPRDNDHPMSFKVNQLTGQGDHQLGQPTQSKTESQAGLRGTDLGASFEHNGKLYFLFGDTHWLSGFPPGTADSIAYTNDTNPWNGVTLYFHHSYMQIHWPDIPSWLPFFGDWMESRQGEYDVPQDGFSFGGHMFVFFSTDHYQDRKVMGRSVLTRCTETDPVFERTSADHPLGFDYLAEFSRLKFINVSVEHVYASQIRRFGLPGNSEGLLIWGTGAYRADHVYLAYMPLDEDDVIDGLMGGHRFENGIPRMQYFAGRGPNGTRWSRDEREAVPLFYPAALGELSVRWNPALRAWVMMYMSGPEDPIGMAVTLRLSRTPWGPWSPRRRVFDWVQDGMGWRVGHQSREGWFIHVASSNTDVKPPPGLWPNGRPDLMADEIIGDHSVGGAAYAPYQIPSYTREDGGAIHLFYALSTWNPYQAVLMRHPITWTERYFLLLDPYLSLNPKFSRALLQRRSSSTKIQRAVIKRRP